MTIFDSKYTRGWQRPGLELQPRAFPCRLVKKRGEAGLASDRVKVNAPRARRNHLHQLRGCRRVGLIPIRQSSPLFPSGGRASALLASKLAAGVRAWRRFFPATGLINRTFSTRQRLAPRRSLRRDGGSAFPSRRSGAAAPFNTDSY